MRKYFYTDGKDKFGPFSKDELKHQQIKRSTKVWYFGLENWTEISELSDLNDVVSSIPPEINFLKVPVENVKQDSKEKPTEKTNQKNPNPKKSNAMKWILGFVSLIVISYIIFKSTRNQTDANLHQEIAACSYNGDADFNIYVKKFYRDLEIYGIYPQKPRSTIIKFSKLDQLKNTTHIHGLSFGHNDDSRIEIYINPSSWQQFTKPMRYFLMYHELAHDVLNLNDLDNTMENEGKLMYPEISSFENKNMDDFIESFHKLFEEHSKK